MQLDFSPKSYRHVMWLGKRGLETRLWSSDWIGRRESCDLTMRIYCWLLIKLWVISAGVTSRKQQWQMWPGHRITLTECVRVRVCMCVCHALFRHQHTLEWERLILLTVWFNKQTRRRCIRSNGWSVCSHWHVWLTDGEESRWERECWRVWMKSD